MKRFNSPCNSENYNQVTIRRAEEKLKKPNQRREKCPLGDLSIIMMIKMDSPRRGYGKEIRPMGGGNWGVLRSALLEELVEERMHHSVMGKGTRGEQSYFGGRKYSFER